MLVGTITQMYGYLYYNKIDFMGSMVYRNESITDIIDTLTTHYIDGASYVAPIAQLADNWDKLIHIFTNTLWLLVGATLIITITLWYLVANRSYSQENHHLLYLQDLCLQAWGNLLGVSQISNPATRFLRLSFLAWVIFSFYVSQFYQTKLMSVLSKPGYEHQIANIEEAIDFGLSVGFISQIKSWFENSTDITTQIIHENFVACDVTLDCINRIAYKRDIVVLKNRRQIQYLMAFNWLDQRSGRTLLYQFSHHEAQLVISFVVRKGFPLTEYFDFIILQLLSNGLVFKWDRDYAYNIITDDDTSPKPFKIKTFTGVFIGLIFGLSLATISFVAEIIRPVKIF